MEIVYYYFVLIAICGKPRSIKYVVNQKSFIVFYWKYKSKLNPLENQKLALDRSFDGGKNFTGHARNMVSCHVSPVRSKGKNI